MAKLLKETPVYIACLSCGKTQHVKLKWVKHRKAMKCRDCGKGIDLKDKRARRMIDRTVVVAALFEKTLVALHAEAKKLGKSVKQTKSKKKKSKKKAKPAKKAPRRAKAVKIVAAPAPAPVATPAAQSGDE